MALMLIVFSGLNYQMQLLPMFDQLASLESDRAALGVRVEMNARVASIEQALNITSSQWGRGVAQYVDDIPGFDRIMIPVLQNFTSVSAVHMASDHGEELMLLQTDTGWKNRSSKVEAWGKRQLWQTWSDAYTPTGKEWQESDYDNRVRPWFTGALATKSGEIHWTAPYMFIASGLPGMTAATHWKDETTGHHWVIALDVKFTDFSHFTNRLTVGKGGYATVLTEDIKVLGIPKHPNFTNDEQIRAGILKEPEELGLSEVVIVANKWRNKEVSAGESVRFVGAGGDEWIGQVSSLRVQNQQLWIVTVAPFADFSVLSSRYLMVLGAILGGLVLLATLVTRRLARRLAQPLTRLVEESERIGRLELDRPVGDIGATVHEMATLGAAQEKMRQLLKKSTQEL
ncbi:MAG: hypothetical protein ACOYNZ_20095, partial [Rhodoferax sp.]